MKSDNPQTTVAAVLPFFRAKSWHEMRGKPFAATTLDRDCPAGEITHLMGAEVIVAPTHDGAERLYRVVGIESYPLAGPRPAGQPIGLLLEPLP